MATSQDQVGIIYSSVILARGIFNRVVNVTFGAYNFDPDESNPNVVSRDPVIVGRVRMDIPTARQLYKALGELLDAQDQSETPARMPDEAPPKKPVVNGAGDDEEGGLAAGHKPN